MDMDTDNVLQRVDACDLDYKFTTKDVEELQYPKASEGAIVAPTACKVVKVLVNEGMEVKKGQHMFSLDVDQVPLSELVKQHNAENSPMAGLDNKEDVLKRYGSFKKFDTVVDHSDHHFSAQSSSSTKQPKDWVDKIREEWTILAENLPETIFVRVYEDRIDLLRAVIIGPPGTPYHDGLFFDVYFPSNYPNSPPVVVKMHKKKIKKAAVKAPSRSALLFPSSEHEKVEVKKYLEEISGVSCSSIEDVLVEQGNNENSAMIVHCNEEDTLKRYENFKQFDTVVDHSDHLFSAHTSAVEKASRPKEWFDRISEEWKVLQEHLPDTIFVRVFEDRKDLLRAVIIGQEGTPYQDALFFFDVCFPSDYPYSSPLVSSHTGVLDIGQNQSTCGKVSWFLRKTTSILKKMWVPGTSNILQFLVYIQGLVLNAKPLFNGYTFMTDVVGQWRSLLYNENTIIKSLKTMVYTMKRPPKHFEFFVDGHFCKRARDILLACRSYTDGLQVGCLASGKNKTCSIKFRKDVTACVKPLVTEFNKRGACFILTVVGEEHMNGAPKKKRKVVVGEKVMMTVVEKEKRKRIPLRIEKILERSRSSRVGIFSIEDVSVDENNSFQMEGLAFKDVLRSYKKFSKFDIVVDHSDHFFSTESSAMNQLSPLKEWVDKIREEWRILTENLPGRKRKKANVARKLRVAEGQYCAQP
ncbi:ubiquitin-conjugating enzyme/RWD-like protein [Tanacetum coccineum]